MSSIELSKIESKIEQLQHNNTGDGLIKLASAQYAVINTHLRLIATSSNMTDEEEAAETKLHHYRETILDLIANSRCTSPKDILHKLEFLDKICTTESCFDEHYYEGQLFKSVVRDAPLLRLAA